MKYYIKKVKRKRHTLICFYDKISNSYQFGLRLYKSHFYVSFWSNTYATGKLGYENYKDAIEMHKEIRGLKKC